MRESARTLGDQSSLPTVRSAAGFEQIVGVPKYLIERRMREMEIDQPVVHADHLIGIIEFETESKRVLKSRADFLAARALVIDQSAT
jgi:hypothetical protein